MNVCFYRLFGGGVLCPESRAPYGGAETRSRLFATELAKRPGFDVSYVVADEGQPPRQRVGELAVLRGPDGIEIGLFAKAYQRFRKSGRRVPRFPWIQIDRWRTGLLWQVPLLAFEHLLWRRLPLWLRVPVPRPQSFYGQFDFDVVCCFGITAGAADVIASCRRFGIRSVVFLVHDREADAELLSRPDFSPSLSEYGKRAMYALQHADRVVVQTDRQKQMVESLVRHPVVLIRNPIDMSSDAGERPPPGERFVFWVGRDEEPTPPHKRPTLCLELARRCAPIPFLAVINPVDRTRFEALRAAAPDNVRIVESVPRDQMGDYYRRSAMLVNTSAQEGFPNTFLEAAKYKTPVVSLEVDPDGFLRRNKCGVVCDGDLDRMAVAVRELWHAPESTAGLAQALHAFVEREHELSRKIDQLVDLLHEVCGAGESSTASRQPVSDA